MLIYQEGLVYYDASGLQGFFRTYGEQRKNFAGQNFWARGYYVSTAGRDEDSVREYIRRQEEEDRRLDQLNMLE